MYTAKSRYSAIHGDGDWLSSRGMQPRHSK